MSLLDMSEFGEAAEYLRKSYTEQLKLQTIPFDGKPQALGHGSQWRCSHPFPGSAPRDIACAAELPPAPREQEDLSRFLSVPLLAEQWKEVAHHLL